jgi:NitT/TauT family transport system substrate-binding protein
MRGRTFFPTAIALVGLLSLSAPSLATTRQAPSQDASTGPLTVVKYGLPVSSPTLDTVGVWFGIDQGFCKDQGLDVQPTGYGRATSIRAMLSGDADIIEIDSGSAMLAYNSGAPLTFINMPIPGALDVIIANPSITSVDQAAGKKWATSGPGSQGEVFAKVLLQRHGIDPNSVTFVPVGSPPDRARALLAGQIDITTMTTATSPEILDAISAGQINQIGTIAAEIPDYVNVFDATTPNFITDHPDIVQKFITCELQGYRWAAENPDEAAQIAANHIEGSTTDLTKAGIERMVNEHIWNLNSFTTDQVGNAIKFLADSGLVKGDTKPEDVTNTTFADAAVAQLGQFTAPGQSPEPPASSAPESAAPSGSTAP